MQFLTSYTRKVLARARGTYGNKNQILVTMEELNELSAALAKYGRYRKHDRALEKLREKVLDEAADVANVLDHVQAVFEITDEQLVQRCEQKAERLERWLDNSDDLEYTTEDRDVANTERV